MGSIGMPNGRNDGTLRYAHEHEHGAPWNADTCSNAAAEGHLDCLRYAHEHEHEHGAPWDSCCVDKYGSSILRVCGIKDCY